VIAGYFYSVFVTKIEEYSKADKKIDWADITITRYIDWSITTPLMILALSIVLSTNVNKTIHAGTMLSIIALNYMMLYLGYLGETKALTRITAMFYSFIAFFAMFSMIFVNFVLPKYRLDNYILFGLYFSIWSLYGVAYMFNEEYKNITMNILDATAKCLIGLGLWLYYIRVIKL
jgi:bacteriorhodopsin